MENVSGKKVFVGLSGGVDSAVSAALLVQAGAQVTGVFIKGWYPPGMPCTWSEDRQDAMRAAAKLRIPFYTLDASKEYKQGVIDYLLTEYKEGHTPNPDVMCNREVKFGAFWRFAVEHGADFIATGHYVERVEDHIRRGTDAAKDQSYFLWAVPKEVLLRTLFPVGSLDKSVTRELAQKYEIPQAAKKDSQGVCFLGTISVDEFLRREIGVTPGTAVDFNGKEVGTHEGSVLTTIGERVKLANAAPGPWYVTKKDTERNILTVAHTPESRKPVEDIQLVHTNWIGEFSSTDMLTAQYRYHGPRVPGRLDVTRTRFTPSEALPEAIAPGQSLVLYNNDVLLGGGIIA